MSHQQDNTSSSKAQAHGRATDFLRSRHWGQLSTTAVNLHHLLPHGPLETTLPAPSGEGISGPVAPYPLDLYLARCLSAHLRVEFPNISWPDDWLKLRQEDITDELLAKLQLVGYRGSFLGCCEICREWCEEEAVDDPPARAEVRTQEVADAFLESKRNGLAEGSILKYASSLRTFTKEHPYLPLTLEPIEAYLADRPASSSKRYLYALLSELYQFAHDRLNIPNVMERIKRPRKGKSKESDYLTLEQLKTLLSPIDDDRLEGMVDIMVGQGFRRSEVIRANVGDIADDRILVHGKEAEEWMPLLPEVRAQLLKQAEGRKGADPLFVSTTTGKRLSAESINKIIRQAFQQAGVNSVRTSPHTLRHTYCTLMLSAGCDRYSVELLMRHRTQNTTDIYAHTSTEQRLQLLKPKLEQFSPLRLLNGHRPWSAGNLL